MARKRQRSKRRTKVVDVTKLVRLKPRHVKTTTSTTYVTAPGVMQYPREQEQHAVTTNQEPPANWPDVDLPPLTGFTTTDQPMDNGQANPGTIYNPAETEVSPYNDYTMGNSSSGAGDMYPGGATDIQGDQTRSDTGG